ncbi:hypothetical protein RhiirA4_478208 [Rhizophagus irregularis]|uniref:Protein kinase domain-containing protein n=1 Tax=Rhizophagus irregularis TaxID=588596 RepID=A0A2I1HEE7_9GLOM|nr:hypothetical protein RhiirA4_478208 [Rhizophagus irregularis]
MSQQIQKVRSSKQISRTHKPLAPRPLAPRPTKSAPFNNTNITNGNNNIDKFIQDAQLSSHVGHEPLEWIPYDRLYDVKYIAKGGFGKVYRAKWIDGYIDEWDDENQNWKRKGQNKFVALKSLKNSKNVTLEFMNDPRAMGIAQPIIYINPRHSQILRT